MMGNSTYDITAQIDVYSQQWVQANDGKWIKRDEATQVAFSSLNVKQIT